MFVKFWISIIFLLIFFTAASAQQKNNVIRAGIVNGAATYLPKPEYPQEAKDFCVGGKVEIEVLIGEDGKVVEAKAISGDKLLHDVSVKAAKKATFSWMIDAPPVKKKGIVVYNFDSLAPKCISVGIVNKRAQSLPKPQVPNFNQPRHLRITEEQIVAVQIIVDMDGKVTAARAVSGHPMLRAACTIAARQAKFSPTFIDGPPVKVKALLVYKFKTDGTIDTNIEKDDKVVIGTPINLVEPPFISCTCNFGSENPKVVIVAEIDEGGNISKALAVTGHPMLRKASENAAQSSKFLPLNIKSKLVIIYSFEKVDKWSVKFSSVEIKNADELKDQK